MEKFTKQHTNLCKGVAICIMLFHHLFFREESWSLYHYIIQVRTKPLIGFIAIHGKICVAIFVLLSAYGLTFTMTKMIGNGKSIAKTYRAFIGTHILKLYELYWPVFILAMVIGSITQISNPITVYKSLGEGLRDFFGIAYIFDGETPFNGAWWYVSFAITLYLIFPILYRLMENHSKLLLVVSFIVGIRPVSGVPIILEWKRYMFICCLGIFLAKHDGLSFLISKKSPKIRMIVSSLCCMIFFVIRCIYSYTFDGFFALAIIVFSVSAFLTMKYFSKVLISLGKYSGTMFLLHGLFYINFAEKFIYGFKYPILIFSVLLIISYCGSVFLKKVSVIVGKSLHIGLKNEK